MAATNSPPRQTGMTSEKLRETPGAKAAESAPRRQKTAKYDRKLVEILRTAAAVFAEVGFDPASIRMVADRADISVAGLYYYVHSKEELLYLIQYHVFDGLVRRFDTDSAQMLADGGEAARPEARLFRFIHNHLDHFLADMDSLTVCTRELRRLNGDYLQEVEALQRAYFSQAFEIFQELCSSHDGVQMDPRTATLAMFGAINWVSTWYNPASDKSARELAGELVNLYLRGVTPIDPEAVVRIREKDLEAVSKKKNRGRQ
jgi:AcrR family transcriptional regulator